MTPSRSLLLLLLCALSQTFADFSADDSNRQAQPVLPFYAYPYYLYQYHPAAASMIPRRNLETNVQGRTRTSSVNDISSSSSELQSESRQLGLMVRLASRLWSIRQGGTSGLWNNLNGLVNDDFNSNDDINSISSLIGTFFTRNNSTSISNPLAYLFGANSPINLNPNSPDVFRLYDSCTAPNGKMGVCVPQPLCSVYPETDAENSCGPFGANVCCLSSISSCGGTMILNNTYWKSPRSRSLRSGTTCGLAIRLDDSLIEQRKPICQIRLDFHSFNLAQPDTESVCSADYFQVEGSTNNVPIICGFNDGQHMYLDVPSSKSVLNLNMVIGKANRPRWPPLSDVNRQWNIQISQIPCGASYLAPRDCLQYFTGRTGTIQSFNWKDVSSTATRQLANQDYKICFRTEKVLGQVADSLCLKICSLNRAETGFSLSRATDTSGLPKFSASQGLPTNCNNDYLFFPGGYDPAKSASLATNGADRYCGERLNPMENALFSTTVCSQAKSFSVHYKTNGDETVTGTVDGPAGSAVTKGNLGFCLTYLQR